MTNISVKKVGTSSALDVSNERASKGKNSAVSIGGGVEIYVKPNGAGKAGRGGKIVIRREHNIKKK